MPIKWDSEADAKLFLALLSTNEVKPDYHAIAGKMCELGVDCTPKAITHRITKLKDTAKEAARSNGSSTTPAHDMTTPAKSAAATPASKPKAKPAAKRGAAKVKEENDDEATGESPSKKAKTTPTASKSKKKAPPVSAPKIVKLEAVDEDIKQEDGDDEGDADHDGEGYDPDMTEEEKEAE